MIFPIGQKMINAIGWTTATIQKNRFISTADIEFDLIQSRLRPKINSESSKPAENGKVLNVVSIMMRAVSFDGWLGSCYADVGSIETKSLSEIGKLPETSKGWHHVTTYCHRSDTKKGPYDHERLS